MITRVGVWGKIGNPVQSATPGLHTQLSAVNLASLSEAKSDSVLFAGSVKSKKTAKKTQAKPEKMPIEPIKPGFLNDYGVDIRDQVYLDPPTVAQANRHLLMRHWVKGAEPGTLKLLLGTTYSEYPYGDNQSDPAALGDTMLLIDRPVDVVVKSIATQELTRALLMATGKRLIYPDTKLSFGPVWQHATDKRDRDLQVNRHLYNTYLRDYETLIMQKAGVSERKTIAEQMDAEKTFSALEALMYGEKGLVDAIIVGPERVLTRKNLEDYFLNGRLKAKKIGGQLPNPVYPSPPIGLRLSAGLKGLHTNPKGFLAETEEYFLKAGGNARQIPAQYTTPMNEFMPQSLEGAHYTHYRSLKNYDKADRHLSERRSRTAPPSFYCYHRSKREDSHGMSQADDAITINKNLPLYHQVSPADSFWRVMASRVPKTAQGILDDDVIFFSAEFNDPVAEQTVAALLELNDKKRQQKAHGQVPTHIKLVLNSGGGYSYAAYELRNTIKADIHTPVDIIVTGYAGSCGADLLATATGYRFATPHARVMIHEAWTSLDPRHAAAYNSQVDALHQDSEDFILTIAEASGHPEAEVRKDFLASDAWFNPVESLFYGTKGLIDGVLINARQALTRDDITRYLVETGRYESKEAVDSTFQHRLENRRSPKSKLKWLAQEHNPQDPFENPWLTVQNAAAYHLSKDPRALDISRRFKQVMPTSNVSASRTLDIYTVQDPSAGGDGSQGEAQANYRRRIRQKRGN